MTCACSRVTTPLSGIGYSTDAAAAYSTCAAVQNSEKKNLRYVCIAGESKASLEETNEIVSTTYDGFVTLKKRFRRFLNLAATIIGMVTTVINKSQSQLILSTLSRYMQPICMIARCAGPTVRCTTLRPPLPLLLPSRRRLQFTSPSAVSTSAATSTTAASPLPPNSYSRLILAVAVTRRRSPASGSASSWCRHLRRPA